ncbi:MAG: HNH endonuclease, partial [Actinomycetota bacterium]|nr:HNH endonuclease [Actinomycetota bacterium]
MEPGPVLAGWLSSIDVETVSGHDRVVVLRAHQRMASHYSAHVYADIAAVGDAFREVDDDPLLVAEATSAEIRAA